MYEAYWNLITKPFNNAADKKFFFYGENYEEAYLRLVYSVTESKGLLLLTGEGGSGKSYISKIFMKDMTDQGHPVAYISNPDLDPTEFLQQILYEFGLEYKNKSKAELLRILEEFALDVQKRGKLCIIIVDEAQLIQNEKTLEEVRLLLNLEENNRLLFSIVLVGKPSFKEMVQKNPSVKERTSIQYHIEPLNCRQTGEYIYYRMEKAGCGRELFSSESIKSIYDFSRGVPREINNVCDMALLLGYGENAIVIDRPLIEKAIEDLKGNSIRQKVKA